MFFYRFPISRNVFFFLCSLFFAFLLPGLGYLTGLELEGRKTLFLLVLAIGLWVTEAVPAFAVALLIVGFQIFILGHADGGEVALAKYTQAWSSPVIWLLMGGFFLSLSFTLTGVDQSISRRAIRLFGGTTRQFLFGIMATTAVLSMVISNTASTALMIAMLLPMLTHSDQTAPVRRAFLIGIPAAASIGGMGTLIGSTPNAIAHNYLLNLGQHIEFLSWTKFGIPLVVLLLGVVWTVIIGVFRPPREMLLFVIPPPLEENKKLKRDRQIVFAVFFVTLVLWISAPLHKYSVSMVSFVPIVFLTLTGVVKSADIRSLPWDTLLLIMGGMSLGDSVMESGLASFLISFVHTDGYSPFLVMLVFGYVSVILSNVMSNTAAAAILIPIGSPLLVGDERTMCLMIALCASMATLLPVSTPPNAVAYATGHVSAKHFLSAGAVLTFLGPLCALIILSAWKVFST